MVLAVVVEDDVDFFGRITANVWAEHNVVIRLTMQIFRFKRSWENFDVSSTTIDLLSVFDRKLVDNGFFSIGEFVVFSGQGVEFGVLGSEQTFVIFISKDFTVSEFEFSVVGFVFGLNPVV